MAARHSPWLILADLDQDYECAPALVTDWIPKASAGLCLRIAVREVESWLLADAPALAKFLAIRTSRVPLSPDSLPSPKQTLVDLARLCRRGDIRQDIVPRLNSGNKIGPAYNSRLIEFVTEDWRPGVAEVSSPSLRSCRAAIARLHHPI